MPLVHMRPLPSPPRCSPGMPWHGIRRDGAKAAKPQPEYSVLPTVIHTLRPEDDALESALGGGAVRNVAYILAVRLHHIITRLPGADDLSRPTKSFFWW